jgi:hypothetical protein
MKFTLILAALAAQTALAGVYQDTNTPVVINMGAGGEVQLNTSRRIDQPTLRYQLEKADDLTNTWSVVSTYKGDGSEIPLLDGAFTVSNAAVSPEFESVDFSEAINGSPAAFYRMSHWWVSTSLSEYIDDIDETYVRLRSRDGSKYLYQDPGTGVVSYEAGMDIMDFRSHWYIQTSTQSDRYWIRNRMTGEAVHTASGGGGGTAGATLLVDFGTSGSFRGADVSNPDSNGNYWNGIGSGQTLDMVDLGNNATAIDIAVTSSYGTDYYSHRPR